MYHPKLYEPGGMNLRYKTIAEQLTVAVNSWLETIDDKEMAAPKSAEYYAAAQRSRVTRIGLCNLIIENAGTIAAGLRAAAGIEEFEIEEPTKLTNSMGWPLAGVHMRLEALDEDKYEYAITQNRRKCAAIPPAGDGWHELDWERFELHEDVFWRRTKFLNGRIRSK
jgi:hypothetical protein